MREISGEETNRRAKRDGAKGDEDRSPLAVERRMRIVELVNQQKTITVPELVERIGASPASIRRDLVWLEEQGLLVRTYGGAMAPNHLQETLRRTSPSYRRRAVIEHVAEKRAIARQAVELIQDGETVILDSGSTTAAMVPFLATKRDLLIITNSIDITNALLPIVESNSSLCVVTTGGILHGWSRSFLGMTAEQALRQFFVDKTFLGVRGVSLQHGFTVPILEEVPIKRQMIAAARETIVLADHTKLGLTYAVQIAPLTAAQRIITDAQASREQVEQFEAAGLQIVLAPDD
ncbi:MAG: DeoR/GlpR family DNA-binding transcription regulator [Caldilinea sp.]|nr:DeoR/GlpR family DNA-binding transcription regulator [Caldilinea sp.]MDW8440475.1 DeoR/GlpR family DNA-binding transcription regulator [Caldilineaceae bacterium]